MFRSRPTIRACDFEGNFVEFRGGNGKRGDIGGGGAMRTWFFSGGSTIQGNTVIEGCTFTNNIVSGGASGGAILYAAGGDHDYPKITGFGRQRCQFTGNSALDGHGGAVFNIGPGGHPTFSNCDFEDNSADSGGGMYNSYSSPTLNDCTFAGNWAVDKGGGMYNLDHSKPSLERCTFTGNSAAEGGGIYSDKTSGPTLHYTIVCGNSPDQIYGNWTDEGGNTVYHTSPDLNDDGAVNGADVGLFLVEWGSRGDCLPADFNGDGQVDGADFGLLLLAWTG
jgi:predicted outer membrane repeat protein